MIFYFKGEFFQCFLFSTSGFVLFFSIFFFASGFVILCKVFFFFARCFFAMFFFFLQFLFNGFCVFFKEFCVSVQRVFAFFFAGGLVFLFPGVFFFFQKKKFCLCLRSGFLCVSVRSVSWVKCICG